MDCDLCQIRSSIGYCAECKRLLCEICGIACGECGKNVCVTHVHETRSGKKLCSDCTRARKQRHHHRGEAEPQEKTGFDDLDQPYQAVASSDEELDEERALTASAYKPIPPWKLSLYASGAAALVMVMVLAVPTFRLIAQPWCSGFAIGLCVLSAFWAFTGLTSPNHFENRPRNLFGAAIAVVALLMAVAALQLDTSTRGDDELEAGMIERQNLSPQELTEWRRQHLNKFAPQRSRPTDSAPSQ
ncbi:MAG: hypothetical protein NTZ09_18650 [Candidatus Hydrogenedentes bacterium]|nr:hypothetical protein [Candidatus Hydrogenedentota bacterium]